MGSLQSQLHAIGNVRFNLANTQQITLNVGVNSGHPACLCANTNTGTFCLTGKSNVVAKAAVSRWTGELIYILPVYCRQTQ